ncbi:DEKNAAC104032 [Brettanomyces naardenensis]|uniref:DEKNAAC104032 n=1 Tax=Brettanomyces naardenensis TaxID=13370 RepID=A0A448YQH4_BRENA|nr:DEKNAAC104032 [Brettanomyces naardenensis]
MAPPQFDWYKIPGVDKKEANDPSGDVMGNIGLANSGVVSDANGVVFNGSVVPNISVSVNGITGIPSNITRSLSSAAGSSGSSSLANPIGEPTLPDIFNTLRISRSDRAFHSDESIAILRSSPSQNNTTYTDFPGMASSSQLNDTSIDEVMDVDAQASDAADPSSTPLSLTANELSRQEAKTYLRWYDYIQSRKEKLGAKNVSIDDVFQFLSNFGISIEIRRSLRVMFARWAGSLSIGQFFAFLRLLAHALRGDPISRAQIRQGCNVPKPISIMARKRQQEEENGGDSRDGTDSTDSTDSKLDLDSFTQFILTGQRPIARPARSMSNVSRRGTKKVKFSDEVVCQPAPQYERRQIESTLDYELPMGTLLERLKKERETASSIVSAEELQDLPETFSRFRNVNIDSVSIGGVPASVGSSVPGSASVSVTGNAPSVPISADITGIGNATTNIPSIIQPLAANMTGSASKSMRMSMAGDNLATPQGNLTGYNQPNFDILPGTERANLFLESVLTGEPVRASPSPPPTSRKAPPPPPRSRSLSGSTTLRPPAPPPRKMSSPPPPTSDILSVQPQLMVPQQIVRPASPQLPPKPILNSQQRQQYVTSLRAMGNKRGGE